MIFFELFFSFFMIGMFSFGGGYAMLPLIQKTVVDKHDWITISQFTDIVAISQITPGPIAVNAATYIGYSSTNSIWGSACATFGVCLPSIIAVLILYMFLRKFQESDYVINAFKALKISVIGLILGAGFLLMTTENFIDYKSIIICVVSFIACYFYNLSPIVLVLGASVAGVLLYT